MLREKNNSINRTQLKPRWRYRKTCVGYFVSANLIRSNSSSSADVDFNLSLQHVWLMLSIFNLSREKHIAVDKSEKCMQSHPITLQHTWIQVIYPPYKPSTMNSFIFLSLANLFMLIMETHIMKSESRISYINIVKDTHFFAFVNFWNFASHMNDDTFTEKMKKLTKSSERWRWEWEILNN